MYITKPGAYPRHIGDRLPLPLPLILILLSEACPDHNLFVSSDRSIIFGMWVHDLKAMCRVP